MHMGCQGAREGGWLNIYPFTSFLPLKLSSPVNLDPLQERLGPLPAGYPIESGVDRNKFLSQKSPVWKNSVAQCKQPPRARAGTLRLKGKQKIERGKYCR